MTKENVIYKGIVRKEILSDKGTYRRYTFEVDGKEVAVSDLFNWEGLKWVRNNRQDSFAGFLCEYVLPEDGIEHIDGFNYDTVKNGYTVLNGYTIEMEDWWVEETGVPLEKALEVAINFIREAENTEAKRNIKDSK